MKLSSKQLDSIQVYLNCKGVRFVNMDDNASGFGYISRYDGARKIIALGLYNKDEDTKKYKDRDGVIKKGYHDPRKTLAHELTHMLQTEAGFYERAVRANSIKTRTNYNEIVANSIGMLCYPTEANIIDNASYVNYYMRQGTGDLMQYLKDDINRFYPIVKAILEHTGLI